MELRLENIFGDVFDNFYKLRKKHVPSSSINDEMYPVFIDLEEKLTQLWILYKEMENTFLKVFKDLTDNLSEESDSWLKLKAITEAIYYLAHRIKKILNKEIPGFKKFEPTGIRNVRNHYFEHPKLKYSTNKLIKREGPVFGIQAYTKLKDNKWVLKESNQSADIYKDLKEFNTLLNAFIIKQLN